MQIGDYGRMAGPKLFLADQSLVQAGGHHLTYNSSLANAARSRGLTPIILANRFATADLRAMPLLHPTFSSTWHNDERPYGLRASSFAAAQVNDLFAFELFSALEDLGATNDDHLFLHTVGFYEAGEILRGILRHGPAKLPVVHLLCRRDLEEAPLGLPRRREFELAIGALARNRDRGIDIRFYTDTPQLSLQYGTATGVWFETLPLPFPVAMISDRLPASREQRATRSQTRFCYLGDARDEKGYQHLPGAIARMASDLRMSGAVHFTLQSNFNVEGGEPGSGPARGKLRAMPSTLVDLRMLPLSEQDYYDVLCTSDAVIVPYDVACYTHRSSGIFTEALHSEAIPIVPAGTSMAAQLPPDFPTVFRSTRDLTRIFETLHADKAKLRSAITDLAAAWRKIHTPEGIIDRLLRRPPVQVLGGPVAADEVAYTFVRPERDQLPAPAPCVLVQIDLESFFYRVGAARTMELQVRTLRALGYLVYVIAVVQNHLDEQASQTSKPSHWLNVLNDVSAKLEVAGAWMCWNGRNRPDGQHDLIQTMAYRRQVTVPEGLREFARWATPAFILVNYVQNMPVIDKLGLGDLPLVIETHDIQSTHLALYDRTADFKMNLEQELDVLRRAVAVSCVTDDDAAFLHACGIEQARSCVPVVPAVQSSDRLFAGAQDLAEILAAGISDATEVNIEPAWREGRTDQIFRLHREKSIDILFIGSWHRPNIEGFAWFYNEVFRPRLEADGFNCVVAGGVCAERHRFPSDKIFWAGTLEDLSVVKAAARIIIAPLLEGTGINVKVLDAIELGKPIVGTGVALRGVTGETQALRAYDDPQDFADRVVELLSSRSKRLRAAGAVRDLGEWLSAKSDYARHYDAMLPGWAPVTPASPAVANRSHDLLEFTSKHEVVNRLIRVMVTFNPGEREVFDFYMNRLDAMGDVGGALLRFMDSLYVVQDAPILRAEGFRTKLQTDLLAAPTAQDALFKTWARIADRTFTRRPPLAQFLTGAQTIGEVLVRAGGNSVENEHLAVLEADPANDIVAKIAEEGFDIVLWFGPNNYCQDAAAWLYNEVIKTSDALRYKTILITGPASKHRFLDGHVFFVGAIDNPSCLPLLGRTLVLPCEHAISLHPEWMWLASIADAVGTSALAFDLSFFGDGAPPSFFRDKAAWERVLIERTARPRAPGTQRDDIAEMMRGPAPKMQAWLEALTATDVAWSARQAQAGRFFATALRSGQDEAVQSLAELAKDPRFHKTVSLQIQGMRRQLAPGHDETPDMLDLLDDAITAVDELGRSEGPAI